MPNITVNDLFAKIGELTMQNEALIQENSALRSSSLSQELLAKEEGNVPSAVSPAVPGPNDDSRLD